MLIPEKVGLFFGIETSPSALLAGQLAGLGSMAIALFTWLLRNTKDLKTQHAITLTLFIVNTLGIILSVKATFTGTMRNGWPAIGFYVIFSLVYFYFRFLKRSLVNNLPE